MPSFYNYLLQKITEFSITLPNSRSDVQAYIRKELLYSPFLLSTIQKYSFRYSIDHLNDCIHIHFSVTYDVNKSNYIVFQVCNQLELNTSISLMYRFHFSETKIIVDNQSNFITEINKFEIINQTKMMVDEELQTNQMKSSSIEYSSLFNGSLIIYTLKNILFDTAKAVNDMSCYAAALGIRLHNDNHNEYELLGALKDWFIQNITYKNNNLTADHSAVSMIANKTGVCQAIAAFAFQVLSFCGLKARYVHGEGNGTDGWGSHAWNMVFINNQWIHIDYTFDLHNLSNSLIKPLTIFKKDHRWDESLYSDLTSETYVQTRRALDHSIIIALPNSPCYSVNGCIVDTSSIHPMCLKQKNTNQIYISIFDIVTISGGYHELIGGMIHIYFDSAYYQIPLNSLKYYNNNWYCSLDTLRSLCMKVDLIGSKILIQNSN